MLSGGASGWAQGPGEERVAERAEIHTTKPATSARSRSRSAYEMGLDAERRVNLFEAREHFRKAMQEQPTRPGLAEHAAWFLYLNGFHNAECVEWFKACRKTASDPAAVRRAMAHVHEEMGLTAPNPQPTPQSTRSDHPVGSLAAKLQRARIAFWNGKLKDARSQFKSLVAAQPDNPSLRWELAKVLVAEKNYKQAAAHLKTAQRLRPGEPELVLDRAVAEAHLGHRHKSLGLLGEQPFVDQGLWHRARARAYHYSGDFASAAREYQTALQHRPHDEIASHGLTECHLRNGSIPEARDMLGIWSERTQLIDWSDRFSLEKELTRTRVNVGLSFFENSSSYTNWNAGVAAHLRPRSDLKLDLEATHGWFGQDGFHNIERNTGLLVLSYQISDFWSLAGMIGVNDYDHGWTSLTGGMNLMIRPFSSLELNLSAEHIDVVDSEPPLGFGIYDLASSIGAVGGRATMDAASISARWSPVERVDVFGKYRVAELSGDNSMHEAYASISYTLTDDPGLKLGYGIGYTTVDDAAALYTDGASNASYFYDPLDKWVHNIYLDWNSELRENLTMGTEAHLYLFPDSGGTGFGLFSNIRYRLDDQQSLRLDARYFMQDQGLNRNRSRSGHYDAFNLVAIYEYEF